MGLSVVLNGKVRVVDGLFEGASLAELVSALELREDRIAVELNGEIVARGARADVKVNNGDRIELVHFVGGGQA